MRITTYHRMAFSLLLTIGVVVLASCSDQQKTQTGGTAASSKSTSPSGSGAPESPSLQKIKFSTAVLETLPYFPATVAKEKGIWRKNGLDVEVVSFKGAGPQMQALAAGEVKAGATPATVLAGAIVKGVEAKVIAEIVRLPSNMVVIVPNDSPIKTWRDLKGKKLSITSFASGTDFFAQRISASQGWDAKEGIVRVPLGAFDTQSAALLKGETDAMLWTLEGAYTLEEKAKTRIIGSVAEVLESFEWETLFLADDVIQADPNLARKVIKGWLEAVEYMQSRRSETIEMAATSFGMSEKVMEKVYDKTMPIMSATGTLDSKGMEAALQSLVTVQAVDKVPPIDKVFDTRFTKQ